MSDLTIHYAIEIDVSDSIDIPDEKEIGLFRDALLPGQPGGGNAFRWITERPDYDGAAVIPTGDLTTVNATKWGEGRITARADIESAIRMININTAGDYGSLSGFGVSVDNVEIDNGTFVGTKFSKILEDNNINFLKRPIRFYVVIDDVFYNYWTGVVSEVDETETKFRFICKDNFRDVHKTMPPNTANESLFPNILKKDIGKPIPVTLGYVNHAKSINVRKQKDPIIVVESIEPIFQQTFKSRVAVVIGLRIPTDQFGTDLRTEVSFLTGIKRFPQNELRGKYLRFVNEGGGDTFYEITETDAPDFRSQYLNNYSITVFLNEIIDISGFFAFDDPTQTLISQSRKYTWVEIFDFESVFITSNEEVVDFPDSPSGQDATLNYFDKDDEEFIEVSEALTLAEKVDVGKTGFPGFIGFADSKANNGDFFKEILIKPRLVLSRGLLLPQPDKFTFTSSDYPDAGELVPNLIDGNRSTKYSLEIERLTLAGETFMGIRYRVYFPDDIDEGDYEQLYMAFDCDARTDLTSTANIARIVSNVQITNVFGFFAGINESFELFTGKQPGSLDPFEVRLIHPSQYNEGGISPAQLGAVRKIIDLKSLFYSSRHEVKSFPIIDVNLLMQNDGVVGGGGDTMILDVFQIAIAGLKKLRVSDDTIFVRVEGEKTAAGDSTINVYQMFKKILQTYDGLTETTEFDLTDIESRLNWIAGRQLLDQKPGFTYLKELAKQSFIGIFPTRKGLRKFSAFREDTTISIAFSHDNGNILQGSIGKKELSPINEVYNEFNIQYEKNVSNGRFDKSVFITKVFEDAFPSDRLASTGTDQSNPGDFTAHTNITLDVDDTGAASGVITFASVDTSVFVVGGAVSIDDTLGSLLNGVIEFGNIIEVTSTKVSFTFRNLAAFIGGESTATGTVIANGTTIPEWATFAGGYTDYNKGKKNWEACHDSYLKSLTVWKLPDSFSKCNWFIDETGFGRLPADNTTAHKYLDELIEWTTRQKEIIPFSIPITVPNVELELLEFCSFRDKKHTSNQTRIGYITKIKIVPGGDRIDLRLTLIPEDIADLNSCIINETGLQTDTINETGAQPDTIDETGNC